jgi:hypothetical protein
MDGHEVLPAMDADGGSSSSSSSRSAVSSSSAAVAGLRPLLSYSQHQVACLRVAYKFIDDLFPELHGFSKVADPPPTGCNAKSWWRLAETAILAEVDWQLHDFFRDVETPPSRDLPSPKWWR